MGKVVFDHTRTTLTTSDVSTKALEWVIHIRHTGRLMGEYGFEKDRVLSRIYISK